MRPFRGAWAQLRAGMNDAVGPAFEVFGYSRDELLEVLGVDAAAARRNSTRPRATSSAAFRPATSSAPSD